MMWRAFRGCAQTLLIVAGFGPGCRPSGAEQIGQTLRLSLADGGALVDEGEGAGAGADEGLELVDHGDEAPVVAAEGLLLGVVELLAGGAEPLVEGPPGCADGADSAETAVELGGAVGKEADAIDCHWFC